jgi:hypothetical protein
MKKGSRGKPSFFDPSLFHVNWLPLAELAQSVVFFEGA